MLDDVNNFIIESFEHWFTGALLDLMLRRTCEPMEKLVLHIHSWQVKANIFKVMRNAFLHDFYFSL